VRNPPTKTPSQKHLHPPGREADKRRVLIIPAIRVVISNSCDDVAVGVEDPIRRAVLGLA
jgi:hypothetical protein